MDAMGEVMDVSRMKWGRSWVVVDETGEVAYEMGSVCVWGMEGAGQPRFWEWVGCATSLGPLPKQGRLVEFTPNRYSVVRLCILDHSMCIWSPRWITTRATLSIHVSVRRGSMPATKWEQVTGYAPTSGVLRRVSEIWSSLTGTGTYSADPSTSKGKGILGDYI
ncbi:hypothetical protein Syun_016617 [Stephania yunnanensis]|uniref:Uncharacterized protein n=1 Tax=Stephania yunnanensis TaxID=152371 RepID=A0AAP0J6D3_9MAGN